MIKIAASLTCSATGNFERMKSFASQVAQGIRREIGSEYIRVAGVSYATTASIEFDFLSNANQVANQLSVIP